MQDEEQQLRTWKRLLVGVVALASSTTPALVGLSASAAHAADEWAVYSLYSFEDPLPGATSRGGTERWRATFKVPNSAKTVEFEHDSVSRSGGGVASVSDGYAVVDLEPDVTADGRLEARVDLTADTGSKWKARLADPVPARETTLTVNASRKSVKTGGKVTVSGELMAGGQPIAGHWVILQDIRHECRKNNCSGEYHPLAQTQVDAKGRWKTSLRIDRTVRLAATYCTFAEYCMGNSNSPALAWGPVLKAKWAPKVTVPKKIVAKKSMKLTVKASQGKHYFTKAPIRVQALRKGKWKTIAKGRLKAGKSSVLQGKVAVKLPVGKHRLRVKVLRAESRGSRPVFATSIEAGTSAVKIVKVQSRRN